MSERTPPTGSIRHAWAKAHPFPLTTEVEERYAEFDRWLEAHDTEVRASIASEEPDPAALRAARAETWDEAISAVFAWWSAPENERPALIVNPYGVGPRVEQENG